MMLQYDDQAAARLVDDAAPEEADATLRAYTASLYARSPWLREAGRFFGTVKGMRDTVVGQEQVLLSCAAAYEDSIDHTAMATYDMVRLQRAREVDLDAGHRQQALRRCLIGAADPAAPGPPPAGRHAQPDVWLHGAVEHKWVDFVHPAHALASLWRDEVAATVKALDDEALVAVPFDADPHRLAGLLAAARAEQPQATAALLARRGVLVWGDDPRAVFERMLALLERLDAQLSRYVEVPSVTDHRSEELVGARRRFAQSLRGAARRVGSGPQLAIWRHDPELQAVLRNREVLDAATEAWLVDQPDTLGDPPLVLEELDGLNPEALALTLDKVLLQTRRRRAGGTQGTPQWPQVLLIPDLGLVALGDDRGAAERRAGAWAHALRAIAAAQALELYQPCASRPPNPPPPPPQALPLQGRIALVTSAGSGIGSATARALLAAGAHVAICARDERVLEAVGEWPLQRFGQRVQLQLCDTRSDDSCQHAVERTCDAFGGLDILVSNAGATASGTIFGDSGHSALVSSLDANLLAHQRIARHVAAAMLQQRSGGVLLFNAAKSAFHQGPGFGPYAVAKAGLISLMRQYAIDLGRFGIRANAVNADRIRTNLISDGVLDEVLDLSASARELPPSMYFRANLLRREATPELVAEAFVYLARADATTGCVITVDGGQPAAFPR